MDLDQKMLTWLNDLVGQGEALLATKEEGYSRDFVDTTLAHQWGTSCLNLFSRVLDLYFSLTWGAQPRAQRSPARSVLREYPHGSSKFARGGERHHADFRSVGAASVTRRTPDDLGILGGR